MRKTHAAEYDYNSPKAWKRPFKNAKKLLWGEAGKSIFSIGATALTARALGVSDFGVLTVLMVSISLITQLITFESWQIVLRYGAEAIQDGNSKAYKHVVGFALSLEILAAILGGLFIFFYTDLLIDLFNIPSKVASIFPWMSILLILNPFGTISQGTLRLTDRFHVISFIAVLPKFLNFLAICVLFFMGYGLLEFIYEWLILSCLGTILNFSAAFYYFRKDVNKLNAQAQQKVIQPWAKGKLFSPKQETWKFAFGLYANSTLGIGTQQLGGPFIAATIGTEAAGLYRIAEKISTSVASPVNKLLAPAVFTDIAWLNAKKNISQIKKMVLRLGAISGGIATIALIILIFLGKPIITLIAGTAFIPAYGSMLVLVLNITLHSATFAIMPLVLTSGWVHLVIIGRSVMVLLYLALMYPLTEQYGVIGAAWATFISSLVATTIPLYGSFHYLKQNQLAINRKSEPI